MKRLLVLTALLMAVATATAQYDYFAYENGRFQSDMTVYVFAEQCALKERPALASKDVMPLAHGDKLLVYNFEWVESVRDGVKQYWYHVEYRNDTLVTSGYICGHDLALGALNFQIDYKRDLLLFQITSYRDMQPYTLTAKVIRDGKTLKTLEHPFIDFHLNPAYPDFSISVQKNIQAGIDEKSEVAEISYIHTLTEFPVGTLYLIWNGEHLGALCETMYLKDPGLLEYESYLVYPGREGVQPGTVQKVEVIREYHEEEEAYLETERIITLYQWDGEKVTSGKE